jgi:hypothetical protein
MGKMYLFYPVPNVFAPDGKEARSRVDRSDKDANVFERGAGECFVACGNDPKRIVRSRVNVAWSDVAPVESAPRTVQVSEDVGLAVKKVWADKKPAKTKYGTVPKEKGRVNWRSYFGRTPLSSVTTADVVFVIGHGSYRGNHLTHEEEYETEEHYYCLRADMVANALMHNGLPKAHVFLKANMCFGGGLTTGAENAGVTFAQTLAIELGKLGYARILVGGYQYAVLHSGNATELAGFIYRYEGMGKENVPALSVVGGTKLALAYAERNNPPSSLLMYDKDPYRCWYDAAGTRVRWNQPDESNVRVPILARTDPDFQKLERSMRAEAEWAAELRRKKLI